MTKAARSPTCPLIVMAKAPVPGYAKTRLIPALGAERSAADPGGRLEFFRHAQAAGQRTVH